MYGYSAMQPYRCTDTQQCSHIDVGYSAMQLCIYVYTPVKSSTHLHSSTHPLTYTSMYQHTQPPVSIHFLKLFTPTHPPTHPFTATHPPTHTPSLIQPLTPPHPHSSTYSPPTPQLIHTLALTQPHPTVPTCFIWRRTCFRSLPMSDVKSA